MFDSDKNVERIKKEQSSLLYLRNNERFFSDAINSYNIFISMIAKFIKELKLDNNSIILGVLIRKLIYYGYFSRDNLFVGTADEYFYDVGLYRGLDIVNGKGCCRHLASFCDDLLKKMDVFIDVVSCYVGKFDTTMEEGSLNESNHSTNLIIFNDMYYIYDCVRDCLLKFVNENLMEEIVDDKIPYRFFYKYSLDIVKNRISYEEIMERIIKMRAIIGRQTIDYMTFLSFKKEANNIYAENTSLFGDLKNESKKHVRKICNELKLGYNEEVIDFYS